MSDDKLGHALYQCFTAKAEGAKGATNVPEALLDVGRALRLLVNAKLATEMGAIEDHGVMIKEAAEKIAKAGDAIADAICRLADAVEAWRQDQ